MANKIQLRRDFSAVWAAVNPILADGEMGLEADTLCAKFGDGSTPWNALGYLRFPGGGPTQVTITGTPAAGTVGLAYSFAPVISGGTGPYTVTNTGAALPPGTALNPSTGAITGTLIGSPASYAGIVLHVVDSLGAVANLSLSTIVVAGSGGGTALSISGTPGTTATVGSAYSFTPSAAGGTGTKTFSLASGTLPAGLSLNSSTGAITGTPTTAGTASGLQLRVTDSATPTPQTATLATFSIVVAAAAVNSKARFGTGSPTAGVSSPQALLTAMTEYGTSNASKAGSFNVAAGGVGVYGWAAIESGASASGVTFTDNLGTGGWQGASSAGNNGTDPGQNPNTSTVTFTDANGVTWRFFRMNYANAAWNGTTS